jgi:catechol 2,3-dioxygenase-like lactoylglutathione lyase family enzyme
MALACAYRRAGQWRGRARLGSDRADLEKRAATAPSKVAAMLKRITHTFIYVLDQDQALDFYVGKLGMVLHTDADLGTMRFLTVNFPDQPDVELGLMLPAAPAYDEATAAEIRELMAKGAAGGGVIFETDDCRGAYDSLQAAGVEFTQEPTERFYGTDCALRDPFGNSIRFTQPPDGPIVLPSAEELQAQS